MTLMLFIRAAVAIDDPQPSHTDPPCYLHWIPTDLWTEITPYLDIRSIKNLWKARDRLLAHHLKSGAVWFIAKHTEGASDESSWPKSLIAQYPHITHIILSRTCGYYFNKSRISLSNVRALPPGLISLDLTNYDSSGTIRSYNFLKSFFLALPKSLQHFGSPFHIDTDNIKLLPQSLTSLYCSSSSMNEAALKALPPLLIHFKSEGDRAFTDADVAHLPDLETLVIMVDKHWNLTYQASIFARLPRNLTHLELGANIVIPMKHLASIPSQLRVLRLPYTTIDTGEDISFFQLPPRLQILGIRKFPAKMLAPCLALLPPTLHTLEIFDCSSFYSSLVAKLPRKLTSLTMRKARNISNSAFGNLPPDLTSLTLAGSIIYQITDLLPESLTYLDVGRTSVEAGDFRVHPRLKEIAAIESHWNFPTLTKMILPSDKPSIWRETLRSIALSRQDELIFGSLFSVVMAIVAKRSLVVVPVAPTYISFILSKFNSSLLSMAISLLYFFT